MAKMKLGLALVVALAALHGPGCASPEQQRGGWDRNGASLGNHTVTLRGAHVEGGTLVR